MRIALVGAGHMGSRHAAAFASMNDVEVAAVVGRGSPRVDELARRLGAVAHADLAPVLDDPSIDAVDVTYPTSLHRPVATAALEAGKHVFCETPLAATPEDAAEMVGAARRADRHLQVALLTRFARPEIDAREAIRGCTLGRTTVVTTSRIAPGTSGAHHGDVLEEIMLFDLDLLCWTFGVPESALATVAQGPTGRPDHAVVALRWADIRGWCEASYLGSPSFPFTASFTFFCEEGTVDGEFRAPCDGPPAVRYSVHPRDGEPRVSDDLGEEPVVAECRRFIDVVRGAADPALLDGSGAVHALNVLAAARRSLESTPPTWAEVTP